MEEQEYEKKQSYIIIPLAIIIILIVIISTYKFYFEEKYDKVHNFKSALKKRSALKFGNEGSKFQSGEITVEITGGVLNPGVYKLKDGSTWNDVIIMAGGLLKTAKTALINRAKKLKDGEKIIIPKMFDYDEYSKNKELITTEDVGYSKLNYKQDKKRGKKSSKININTAPKEVLITLPGIGPKTAESIISYREKNKFINIEDIMQVRRIGKKTFEELRDKICVR